MWHVTWECHLSAGRRCTSIPKKFPMIGSPDLQFTPMQLRGCIVQATIPYPEVQHLQQQAALRFLQLNPCLIALLPSWLDRSALERVALYCGGR